MHDNRHEGIKFRSDGNVNPFMMSDASNKGDPSDSKRAYVAKNSKKSDLSRKPGLEINTKTSKNNRIAFF